MNGLDTRDPAPADRIPHPRGGSRLVAAVAMAAAAMLFACWSASHFVDWRTRPVPAPVETAAFQPSDGPGAVDEIVPGGAPLAPPDPRAVLASDDVPGWRTPGWTAAGEHWVAADGWRDPDDILWRLLLDGTGHACPIVVGDRIYVTTVDERRALWLCAIDFTSGAVVWRANVAEGGLPPTHAKTSDAASTPCSDGRSVFVAWAADGITRLAAYDIDGGRRWRVDVGPFSAGWGYAASPLHADGLVVVGADNPSGGFLAAVAAESGSLHWRRRRPPGSEGSYSSPTLIRDGVAEVLITGMNGLQAFRLRDGELAWEATGLGNVSVITPTVVDDLCLAGSGYPMRTLACFRIDRAKKNAKQLWREERASEAPYVPSPLCHEGRIYVLHDDGMAHCRDLVTGRVRWKRRIGGSFSASPVLLGKSLLCIDESGRCVALSLADGSVRHEGSLPQGCFATPIAVRDRILLRTQTELMCIGPPAAEAVAE